MAQVIELAIGDAEPAGYVVEERRDDGRIVLRPETMVERMHRVNGSRPATEAHRRLHGDWPTGMHTDQ